MSALSLRQRIDCLFLITVVPIAVLLSGLLDPGPLTSLSPAEASFILLAGACYSLIYLIPAWLITHAFRSVCEGRGVVAHRLVLFVAVIASTLTLLVMLLNQMIHSMYGFFMNGFVVNLMLTPGGLESLGGDTRSWLSMVSIVAGIVFLQSVVLWAMGNIRRIWPRFNGMPPAVTRALLVIFVVGTLTERLMYAVGQLQGETRLAMYAERIPFYQTLTIKGIAEKLGFRMQRQPGIREHAGTLAYPVHPLTITKPDKPLNIVWLVSESLRADMLTPDIMPHTSRFASQSQHYLNHYSGGNGTRMGLFSLFTGLPGSYWFDFLGEHRGPALLDVLKTQDYQMRFLTSATFTYPEFDKTIFSTIPAESLIEDHDSTLGWEKDRRNVQRLQEFIDHRDRTKPFLGFMFFESPHARYYFPEESVIRRPYEADLNYATMSRESLRNHIDLLRNRYINAVHHLDSQLARVFNFLAERRLLDSTLVIVTGDHGEEFLEAGFWGHNSEFSEWQIRTPMILHVPGRQPRQWSMVTSHADVTATLMPLLGVSNPTDDYSIGMDMLTPHEDRLLYFADWDRVAVGCPGFKLTLPLKSAGMTRTRMVSHDDAPIATDRRANALAQCPTALPSLRQAIHHWREMPVNPPAPGPSPVVVSGPSTHGRLAGTHSARNNPTKS